MTNKDEILKLVDEHESSRIESYQNLKNAIKTKINYLVKYINDEIDQAISDQDYSDRKIYGEILRELLK